MFHEIGHWFLHPQLVYHRDLPVTGVERVDRFLPPEEREANLFAAESLMPRGLVADLFHLRYGPRVHPAEIDETLAFKLSLGSSRNLTVDDLKAMSRRERSRVIAEDSHAGLPMTELFVVSAGAMAIRLEELLLVL
jgi:Zn-dependent peptidase ImmA (M78 family)